MLWLFLDHWCCWPVTSLVTQLVVPYRIGNLVQAA